MKNYVVVLLILLILWITGSAYWYVCRIRGDCKNSPQSFEVVSSGEQGTPADNYQASADSLKLASVEEAKNYLVSSGIQKVYFELSSALTDMSLLSSEYLGKLKFYLENSTDAKVGVIGHTDSSGTKEFNSRLGAARAEFVTTFLVSSGIKADQIITSSKSFSEPAATNSTREGRAKNRRTEINIIN